MTVQTQKLTANQEDKPGGTHCILAAAWAELALTQAGLTEENPFDVLWWIVQANMKHGTLGKDACGQIWCIARPLVRGVLGQVKTEQATASQ